MKDAEFLKKMVWDLEERFPGNFNKLLREIDIPDPRENKLTSSQFFKLFNFYVIQNHARRFKDSKKPSKLWDINTPENRLQNLI